jgi:hypothetical protein
MRTSKTKRLYASRMVRGSQRRHEIDRPQIVRRLDDDTRSKIAKLAELPGKFAAGERCACASIFGGLLHLVTGPTREAGHCTE